MPNPFKTPLSGQLEDHYKHLCDTPISQLNSKESRDYLRVHCGGLYADFTRHKIDQLAFEKLMQLAKQQKLAQAIKSLFAGELVNFTEERPALHSALRSGSTVTFPVVEQAMNKMQALADAVRSGEWTGFSGKSVKHIVHIGIGGSELGPKMVCQALQDFARQDISLHFISNMDGYELHDALSKIDPQRTLFIIASKTFTTIETLTIAQKAKQWILDQYQANKLAIQSHFVAISAYPSKAVEFGIAEDNVYPMWDWVGGRYSIWSAVGLPVMDSYW